jgi:outer membrane protein assembly factor BamB
VQVSNDGGILVFMRLALFCIGLSAFAEPNWPQWRGPASAGISEDKSLPLEWAPGKNIAWQSEIRGRGVSSPVVWGDHIFLTSAIEGDQVDGIKPPLHMQEGKPFRHPDSKGADRKHQLLVYAVNRKDGKILWERTAYDGLIYDEYHKRGSYASPTPVTDGKHVYFYFGTAGLYAYDFNGKLAWKHEMGPLGSVGMGPGTSPILEGNLILLQCDQEEGEGSFLEAVDKRTGRQVWKTARRNGATWATPVVHKGLLIASGLESTVAYDILTGKEVWRGTGLDGNAVPTPVMGHGMVYVNTGYPKKNTLAFRLDGATGERKEVWSYKKGGAYITSPLLYGDYLYLSTDKGILTCLDAKTGEMKYENGRPPAPSTIMASMVAYNGRILVTNDDGDTYVIKAGPTFEILGKNSVGEPVQASPALAGGSIYIRGAKHLFCIR